jgi:tetratricopeptide (TPR) repeat protein
VFWGQYQPAADLFLESIRLYEWILRSDTDAEKTEAEKGLAMAKQELVAMYVARDELGRSRSEITSMLDEVASEQKRLFGEFHPETLYANALRAFWLSKGMSRHHGSLQELEKCVEKNEKHLPQESPFYEATLNYLAACHSYLGQYDEAIKVNEKAFLLLEKHQGLYHQNTILILSNLATLAERGTPDYTKARLYLERAVQGYERLYGPSNSDTLSTMSRLRRIYLRLGCSEEALEITKRYLRGWEILYGKEHPETASLMTIP